MTTHRQLELLISQLLDFQFSETGTEPQFKRAYTGIAKLDFLSDEIKPFLTHYFADKDENGIHIYSFSAEDSVIYLAETLDFWIENLGVLIARFMNKSLLHLNKNM